MRRVRNQNIHSANPALMFARGVESIVSDHLKNAQHQRHDNEAEQRNKQRAAARSEPQGNFLGLLMRQFASY